MFQILFDNKAHSGKVKLSLLNEASIKECRDTNVSGHGERRRERALICVSLCDPAEADRVSVSVSSGQLRARGVRCVGGGGLRSVSGVVRTLHPQRNRPAGGT